MITNRSIKIVILTLFALIFVGSGWLIPSQAKAFTTSDYVEITETWNDYTVHFTIETNKAGLVEFIVGNNNASGAWLDGSNVPLYTDENGIITSTWTGWTLSKDGTWKDSKGSSLWPADMTGFDDYTKAFFYTSNPDYVIASPNWTPLLVETTYYGFYGSTLIPTSPFAARFTDGTILYGETSHAVPEPATLLLLGLGVMGLAGIRRKL